MRCICCSIALLAVLLLVAQLVHSQGQKQPPAAAGSGQADAKAQPADRSADEAAIRANVEAFVRAYNAGDAKALAALFTPDAIIVDKEDNTVEGREAIQKNFADLFAESPKKRLEVAVDQIRFLGPDLAVEVGRTQETPAPGESPEYDRYTVLHVKRDGKWLMSLARDAEGDLPSSHERLQPLAWLIGDWVDDGGKVVVASTCRWSEGQAYLLQEFKVQVEGKETMQVSQRIGWDPLTNHIRSWVFDSEGGYGESVWTRNGDAWLIKATGVRADGTTGSATNLLVPTGKDGYVWRSTDRIVGDEVEQPIEVKIVRKAPQPKK